MNKESIVRLAQIGLGAWSCALGNALLKSKKAKVVTCFDIIPEKREEWSEKYKCDQDESYESVLKRNDVDGVLLATPNAIHAEQTVLATEYGKHVYVEKPIANTIADGIEMVEACRQAGVTLMTGHYMRRWAGFRKIKELIDGGSIGNFIQVECNFSHNLGFGLKPDDFRWRGDDSGCPGGPLMSMGIHFADTLNYLFGPIKMAFSYFHRQYIKAPVEDVTTTIFQFDSGAQGYLGSNYASPKALWMYVYGTEANLLCTVTPPELPFAEYLLWLQRVNYDTRLQIFKKGETGAKDIPIATEGDPILEEIDEFADCIKIGAIPETDGLGALAALSLVRAAIESAKTGKQTKLWTSKK